MTETERLRIAIKEGANRKNLGTNKNIADFLGYGASYFSSLINGNESLSDKFLSHVCDKLDINRDYIKTGSGSVLRNSVSQTNSVSGNNNTTQNTITLTPANQIELLNAKIDNLQLQNQLIITLLNKLLENESK